MYLIKREEFVILYEVAVFSRVAVHTPKIASVRNRDSQTVDAHKAVAPGVTYGVTYYSD